MSFLSKKIPENLVKILPNGSRIIDWAESTTGYVGVTLDNLLVTNADDGFVVPWSNTIRAQWLPPQLTITVNSHTSSETSEVVVTLPLAGRLPELVRDRITSVVVIDHVRIIPGVGRVRFVARRLENDILWSTFPDQELTAEQQLLLVAATEQIQSHFGI